MRKRMIQRRRFHKDLHHMVSHHHQQLVKRMKRKTPLKVVLHQLCHLHHLSWEEKNNGWKTSTTLIPGVITWLWLLTLDFHTIHHLFSLTNKDQFLEGPHHSDLLLELLRERKDQHSHPLNHLLEEKNNGRKTEITLMTGVMLKRSKQTWEFHTNQHLFR